MAMASDDLSYAELISELFPRLSSGVRWGLERTTAMLDAVGNPQNSFRTIHVGGTNGKGSVAATLASMLRADGRYTGLYSSPHLCTFRERIQIDGNAIDEQGLVAAARKLWPEIQRRSPSFFEATTAIGFLALAEAGVECAVIEVGLGGRLDATNVITPELAIITNIALDHADYLGNTLEAIALEKAGIIKTGVSVITAERQPAPLRVFHERAQELGAPLHVLPADQPFECRTSLDGTHFKVNAIEYGTLSLQTPLTGMHQAANAALAVHAAALLPSDLRPEVSAVIEGVAAVRWPGRLQVERIGSQRWLFDVAHNVAGVQALVATLKKLKLNTPLVVLIGILGDKDWQSMLPPLFDAAHAAVLTVPPTAPPNRAWDPRHVLSQIDFDAEVVHDFTAALERAHEIAGEGTVLVTGSFHTVGDALIALNRAPFGRDVTLPQLAFSG